MFEGEQQDDEPELPGDPDAAMEPFEGDEEPEPVPDPLATYPFAGPAEDAIALLAQKKDEYFNTAEQRGFINMWRIAIANVYMQDPDIPGRFDTTIGVDDADGGQLRVRVADPSSFLRQQITMATGQRAAFQAVAQNTNASAMAMAPVVDAAIDYFYRREMTDDKEQDFMRKVLSLGAAYVWWRWDKWAGDEVELGMRDLPLPPSKQIPGEPPQTAPMPFFGPSGAPVATVLPPWREFHEVTRRSRHLWRCAMEPRSRYELMALFPHLAEQLMAAHGEHSYVEQMLFGSYDYLTSSDDLMVEHLYHAPLGDPNDLSNPLRAGRYIAYVGKVVLIDTRLPTSRKVGLPIVEGMPLPMEDVAFGAAHWWSLIALQQGQDAVVSDVASNTNLFGRTSGFYPQDAEIDLDRLASGGGWFEMGANGQKPEFMTPPGMPQTAPWLSDFYDKKKQGLSGLNQVQRGDPSGISSGEMAALFTNLAVEYNSDGSLMLDGMRRASANINADLVLLNCDTDLLVQVVGVDERPYVVKFRPEQLHGFSTFEMRTIPPLMRQPAGRMQIWNMIKELEPDDRPAAIQMILTGQWRQMTDTSSAEWVLIKWENEQLAQGVDFPPDQPGTDPTMALRQKTTLIDQQLGVKVSATDNPFEHLPQHVMQYNQLAVDPETNAKAIAATLAHIQATLAAYYRADPLLAAMLKFQPPPAPQQPQQAEMPQDGRDGDKALPDGGNESAKPEDRLGSDVPQPAQPPKGATIQ